MITFLNNKVEEVREEVVSILTRRGYQVECRNKVTNGVTFHGVSVLPLEENKNQGSRTICPVIYLDTMVEQGLTVEDMADEVICIVSEHSVEDPFVDDFVDQMQSRSFVLNHIHIRMQKTSKEHLIKRDSFEGMEEFLVLSGNMPDGSGYCVRLSESHLQLAGVSVEEAWEQAAYNSLEETKVFSMYEIMREILSDGWMDPEELPEDLMEGAAPMYVVSNKVRSFGAYAIRNHKLLEEIARKEGVKYLVYLPSSVHEGMVLPCNSPEEYLEQREFFDAMVAEVNASEVDPQERLTDRSYLIQV